MYLLFMCLFLIIGIIGIVKNNFFLTGAGTIGAGTFAAGFFFHSFLVAVY